MRGRAQAKQQRAEALAAIGSLSREELRNLRCEIGKQMAAHGRALSELRSRHEAIKSEEKRRATGTANGFHISEHAVLRYLERIRGIDMDEVREEIAKLAEKSRRERDGAMATRRNDDAGLTLGVDETTLHVTTIYREQEIPILVRADNAPP